MTQPSNAEIENQLEKMAIKARQDRIARQLRSAEAAARGEFTAILMSERAATALARVDPGDVTEGDIATRARVHELEMWATMYDAKADGNRADAIRAAKEIRSSLALQADLLERAKPRDSQDQNQDRRTAAVFEAFLRTPEGQAALAGGIPTPSKPVVTLDVTRDRVGSREDSGAVNGRLDEEKPGE